MSLRKIIHVDMDAFYASRLELVHTLLPTAKGIRLLGVTVSNLDQSPANTADELLLFGAAEAIASHPDAAAIVTATGEH